MTSNSLYTCPPHLYIVTTLPWEIQKSFSIVLFLHTSDYLCYLRRKQAVTPLHTTPEKCLHHPVNCTHFSSFYFFVCIEYQSAIRTSCGHLVATRAEFQQSMVDNAVDQCRKRLQACIRAKGGHFEHVLQRCLHDIPFATHHDQFFSEPPMPTHKGLFQNHQRLQECNIPSVR